MFYFSFVSHVWASEIKVKQICFVSVLFQFHFTCASGFSIIPGCVIFALQKFSLVQWWGSPLMYATTRVYQLTKDLCTIFF